MALNKPASVIGPRRILLTLVTRSTNIRRVIRHFRINVIGATLTSPQAENSQTKNSTKPNAVGPLHTLFQALGLYTFAAHKHPGKIPPEIIVQTSQRTSRGSLINLVTDCRIFSVFLTPQKALPMNWLYVLLFMNLLRLDQTRADCKTTTHVIELYFGKK